MSSFSRGPIPSENLSFRHSSVRKLLFLSCALLSAGAQCADDRFTHSADLKKWTVDAVRHVYSGSVDGSHNGNLFTFALGAGEELSELDFYGASDAAVQNGNRLIFTEGDYRAKDPVQAFHAAHGASREAVGNAVSIEGGNFGAQSKFTAANNTAEAEDARGDAFALTDNVVSITGGTFRTDADVEVAYSETGTLARNRLMIRGLANGRFNMAYAANTESGNASENAIVIEKASNLYVQVDLFAASAGSAAPSTLADNLLFITDSSIDSSSLGAAMNPSGDVVGNRVDIRNSTLRSSSGGNIFVYGGLHQGYGGLDGKIAGNYIRLEDVTLDLTDRQAAFFIAGQISASEGGVLTNNVVELAGDGAWDERLAQARLVGAGRFGGTGQDDVRDNALRLSGWRGVVSSVKGFNTIELSNIPWEAEGAVLRVDMRAYDDWGEIVTEETLDLSGTTFAFVDGGFVFEGGADAHLGESMTLLAAGEHTGLALNPLYDGEGLAIALTTGITTEVEGRIVNAEDGKSIVLELEDAPVPNRQLALVSNQRNAAVTFLGQAAEIVGDILTEPPKDYGLGPKTFAVMNGADVKYESAGKLTVRGMNFLAGAGTSVDTGSGIARVNFFAETGRGEFDDTMQLEGLKRRVDDTMTYYGVGTSARHLWENGFYTEGSLRVGRYENDVEHGLTGADGLSHGYKTRSLYAAAHAGLGRIFPLTAETKLEVFAKYFFTHLPSDSTSVKDSDGTTTLRFESVDNHRVRTGARLYAPAGDWQGYLGAAFEYDFTDTIRNKANGVEIRGGESIRGATGIGEAGLRHAKADSPWLFDVRLRGYCGRREGASLKLQAEYGF